MSNIDMEDETGRPRPERDILDAMKAIEVQMVRNPMALGADGTPLLMHYMVIRDALRELLALRAMLRRATADTMP